MILFFAEPKKKEKKGKSSPKVGRGKLFASMYLKSLLYCSCAISLNRLSA